MRSLPKNGGNRREFFRSGARYGLLAGLAALAGVNVVRGGRLRGQECINRGICSSCASYGGCGLPQALSAKREKGV